MPESTSSAIPTDELAAQRVGTLIKGKWRVEALLGIGGMATVYAATHRNGQRTALKIMHPLFARDPEVVERFLREGYVANKIGHPACVRVIDDDLTDDGEPFLVMELLEGETLRDLWKRTGKRVPLPLVLHVAERLLDCLAACHDAGVIHRDLKPANIYVTNAGDVKLLDFGVALLRDTGGATAGMALGTPAYMSPEQAMGRAEKIDHRVDIFSVGAVIHALASGKRVHRAKNERDALKMAATTPAPSVGTIAPDLPPRVVALIDRALSWEVTDRFADAREMQREVIAIAELLKTNAARAQLTTSLETFHDEEAPPVETLPADDPRAVRCMSATRALGEAIDATFAFGREDPEARAAIDRAADALADALDRDAAVVIEVRQASFWAMGHMAWVATFPVDGVPRHLVPAGVRALRFLRGVGPDEVSELCTLLGMQAELPSHEDLATAIWDLHLSYVRADGVLGFVVADADSREARATQSSELEASVVAAQRKYASRLANPNLRAPKLAGPLAFDADARLLLDAELDLTEQQWSDRALSLLSVAMLDAAKHGEVPAILGALRKSAVRGMEDGRHDDVMRAARGLSAKLAEAVGPKDAPKLEGAVMSAAFGKEALVSALANLHESSRAPMATVLAKLTESDWPAIVTALHRPMSEQSALVLLDSVARVARAKHADLAAKTQRAPPAARRAVGAWLVREGHADSAESLPVPRAGERNVVAAEPSPDEALVLALVALAKLASNRQQATAEYERRVGDAAAALARMPRGTASISLEMAQSDGTSATRRGQHQMVFIDGRLARLTQQGFDAGMELGAILLKMGPTRILDLPRASTADDFRRFGTDVATAGSASNVRRRPMSDVARTHGLELERLPIEQRIARSCSSALLALRALLSAPKAGPRIEAQLLGRVARALVDDSERVTAAFLGTSFAESDRAAVAVSACILAIAAAREITADRRTLAAVAMGALLSIVDRPALLVGLGWADPASCSPAIIAHEAARSIAKTDDAAKTCFAARLVAAATRMAELRGSKSYDESISALASDDHIDASALRAIVAAIGVIPAGTMVELSNGEMAEVVAANEDDGARPLVRLVSDSSRVLELELEDELAIARVVEVDGWKTGPAPANEARHAHRPFDAPFDATAAISPDPGDARAVETGDDRSLRPHSFVRTSESPEETGPKPTAEGTFSTTPFVHLLVYVLDRELSGTLEVRESDGTRHLIALMNGTPNRVVTGRLIAPLGAQLVAAGKLSDVEAASAITGARTNGMPLGKYLVAHGKLKVVDLQHALELQVRRKVAGLVNLPENTTYAFYKDVDKLDAPPSAHVLEVDALDVVLDGVRAWSHRDRIRETLSRYAQLPLTLHAQSTIEHLDLSDSERGILRGLRETPVTLARLCEQPTTDVASIMSLVYTLVITRQVVVSGSKGPLGVRSLAKSLRPPPSMRAVTQTPLAGVAPSPPAAQQSQPLSPSTRQAFPAPPPPPASQSLLGGVVDKPEPIAKKARVLKPSTIEAIAKIEQQLLRKDIPAASRIVSQLDESGDADITAIALWVKALAAAIKPQEAIAELGRVLLDAPDCTRARLYRGKLFKRDNSKLREAVADFEQVLADDPTNKDAAAELRLLALTVKPGRF